MMLVADNRISDALLLHLEQLAEPDAPLAWWRRQVEQGAFGVIAVLVDGARVASVLWELGGHGGRPCFVIRGAAGDDPRFDLMGSVLPELEGYARRLGCALVRFHTRRRGLIARALDMGYRAPSFALVRELGHVA